MYRSKLEVANAIQAVNEFCVSDDFDVARKLLRTFLTDISKSVKARNVQPRASFAVHWDGRRPMLADDLRARMADAVYHGTNVLEPLTKGVNAAVASLKVVFGQIQELLTTTQFRLQGGITTEQLATEILLYRIGFAPSAAIQRQYNSEEFDKLLAGLKQWAGVDDNGKPIVGKAKAKVRPIQLPIQ